MDGELGGERAPVGPGDAWAEMRQRWGLDHEAEARLRRLAGLLRDEAVPMGLLGPAEGARIAERHVADSLECLAVLPARRLAVVDVGSGPGLPGLPLAVCRGELEVTLLDSRARSCQFATRAVAALGVSVRVVCQRAEAFGRGDGRERFDVAVGRAVAPPPIFLEYALPLVVLGGRVVALVGAPDEAELVATARAAVQLGGGEPQWLPLGSAPPSGAPRFLVVVGKDRPTPREYPRRPGVARKRPLPR